MRRTLSILALAAFLWFIIVSLMASVLLGVNVDAMVQTVQVIFYAAFSFLSLTPFLVISIIARHQPYEENVV